MKIAEPVLGIEPRTYGLRNRCSTTELHRRSEGRSVLTLLVPASSTPPPMAARSLARGIARFLLGALWVCYSGRRDRAARSETEDRDPAPSSRAAHPRLGGALEHLGLFVDLRAAVAAGPRIRLSALHQQPGRAGGRHDLHAHQ